MKKYLIFYWYIPNDGKWYNVYNLHINNLIHFKDVFNKVTFVLSHNDDCSDIHINNVKNKILNIFNNVNFVEFSNDPVNREAKYFYYEIVNKFDTFDKDEIVFFAHNKGVDSTYVSSKNLMYWINIMYFSNLYNIKKVDGFFNDGACVVGDIKMEGNIDNVFNVFKYKWIYAGTFFWIHPYNLKQYLKDKDIDIKNGYGRYYAEGFFGNIFPSDSNKCKQIHRNKDVDETNIEFLSSFDEKERDSYKKLYELENNIDDKLKILYVTGGNGVDYLNDLIFIGLVNNGYDVLDSHYLWYTGNVNDEQKKNLYGMGFTISGNLPDRSSLDRNEESIKEKIKSHYFDCIIYGSIWRCHDYYDLVRGTYKSNEVIILDGEDTTKDLKIVFNHGIYFKRELLDYQTYCLPISFSIPKSKMITDIGDVILGKNRVMSYITPKNTKTYIYSTESEYYNDYKKSLFGTTMIKAGADCLRHYEIIGNGCLPYFPDVKNISKMTMVNWPMDLQIESNIMAETYNNTYNEKYVKLLQNFFNYAKENLTSEIVSKKMLEKIF